MTAETAESCAGAGWGAGSFTAGLVAARAAVAKLTAARNDLSELAGDEVARAMGELTTLAGQLDGLRAEVTRQVHDRGLFRLYGARSLSEWLRSDPRTADQAWTLGRLAAMGRQLPRISGLLTEGSVSLAQAGTACWQISQLPDVPVRPEDGDVPDPVARSADQDDSAEDAWAGLWRGGDVRAAADELFARFMDRMDGQQLRVLGAHLREAADAQERAGEEYDDFTKRALRISRSLAGAGELSGRLHAEAAEQVIAAFESLGARTGPDDTRTKAQRWADVLIKLIGLAGATGPGGEPGDDQPITDGGHDHGHEAGQRDLGDRTGGTPTPGQGHPERPAGTAPAGLRRPRVIVTVPLTTLLRQPLAPGATLAAGVPLTGEAARRLACDAEIVRVITSLDPDLLGGRFGQPGTDATAQLIALLVGALAQLPRPLGTPSAVLDVGRKYPGWTPRQRDALYAQYGGRCGRPDCGAPIDVIHHVIHWIDGGRTAIRNGLPLCEYHHWLVHEGGWRIGRQQGGGVAFIPPPPGWRPGTIYRRGQPVRETTR